MNEKIQLLDFLRSTRFILYVTIFTVVFLSPNTYYVFHSLSIFISPYREIASAGVAAIVAASIMIYTLRKNFKVARYFALFEIVISGYYYIGMVVGWSWALIPAISFTFMLPVSVYYYTREIDVKVDFESEIKILEEWLEANPTKKPTDYLKKNRNLRP